MQRLTTITLEHDGNTGKAIAQIHLYSILQSTTPGITKKFKITVDDAGALSAVEVTTS